MDELSAQPPWLKCCSCLVSIAVFPLMKRSYIHALLGEPCSFLLLLTANRPPPSFPHHPHVQLQATCAPKYLRTNHVPPSSSGTFSSLTQCFTPDCSLPSFWFSSSPVPAEWLFLYIGCPRFLLTSCPPCFCGLNGLQAICGCEMIFWALGFSSGRDRCLHLGLFPRPEGRKAFWPN